MNDAEQYGEGCNEGVLKPDGCVCPMDVPIIGHHHWCPAYDPKPLKVYDKPCANCLMSKANLVKDDEIADRMVQSYVDRGSHFICHKATLDGEKNIACHSFFKAHADDVPHLKFYKDADMVEFVPHPANQPKTTTPEAYFGELERRENDRASE